jgi:hypothetical protein
MAERGMTGYGMTDVHLGHRLLFKKPNEIVSPPTL